MGWEMPCKLRIENTCSENEEKYERHENNYPVHFYEFIQFKEGHYLADNERY